MVSLSHERWITLGQGYEAADAAVGFATFAGDPNLNFAALRPTPVALESDSRHITIQLTESRHCTVVLVARCALLDALKQARFHGDPECPRDGVGVDCWRLGWLTGN
jgi:hypothetical protein